MPDLRFRNSRSVGLTLGVLTNGQEAQQRAKLDPVGLLDILDYVIASSTLSASKPAAGAFHEACQRVGHEPQNVLYVGDNLRTDALAATSAGLTGIWLNRLQQPAAEPAHSIGSLTEVIHMADRL
jgi:putative hydrolase of the HAD superfamily